MSRFLRAAALLIPLLLAMSPASATIPNPLEPPRPLLEDAFLAELEATLQLAVASEDLAEAEPRGPPAEASPATQPHVVHLVAPASWPFGGPAHPCRPARSWRSTCVLGYPVSSLLEPLDLAVLAPDLASAPEARGPENRVRGSNFDQAVYLYGNKRFKEETAVGASVYLHDALGSVTDITRGDGSLLGRYQYDAWGNHRGTPLDTDANPFGFTGHEHDGESGLVYAKARFYDSELGIFLSEDPADIKIDNPPSLHKYIYAFQNPTVFVDPDGEEPVTLTVIALAAVIGFTADVIIQELETGATGRGLSGFVENHLDLKRAGLSGVAGGLSAGAGGALVSSGARAGYAAAGAIATDTLLDTGVQAATTEGDFNTSDALAKNAVANTLFAGVGVAGGKLLDTAKGAFGRFFRGADDAASELAEASGRASRAPRPPPVEEVKVESVLTTESSVRPGATGDLGGTTRSVAAEPSALGSRFREDVPLEELLPDPGRERRFYPGYTPPSRGGGGATGGAGPVLVGQRGEAIGTEISGLPKNTRRIPSASGAREHRVPDHMDSTGRFIFEDKAVAEQALTSQLLDDKAYVLRGGGPGRVEIILDEGATISLPLLREHLDPGSPIHITLLPLKDP